MNQSFFSKDKYIQRRAKLQQDIGSGIILLLGNEEPAMNYKDNTYRFRQDSNFLYFGGIALPGLDIVIDTENGETILFGHEYTMDDIIWIGPSPMLSDLAKQVGIDKVLPPDQLATYVDRANQSGRSIHYCPPYRYYNKMRLASMVGKSEVAVDQGSSVALIKAIVSQRSYKDSEEVDQLTDAVNITREMHIAAMQAAAHGRYEYQVLGHIFQAAHQHGAEHLAYQPILSVRGEVLHNHSHTNIMNDGQLCLNDSGAENHMFYAGDITRTFPVSGTFTTKQKDIYQIVLDMEVASIEACRPGILYRDIHIGANRILLEGLKGLGLVKGSIDDMLVEGVGGLFMPHGLGHMIGLDVHDMEDIGEKYVGYTEDIERSTQLGLKSLRLARTLEQGFVITVEPGLYFVPQLIDKWKSQGLFKEFINYDGLADYYDFGGIRIEDDVLITATGHKIIGDHIPKTIDEVETIMMK